MSEQHLSIIPVKSRQLGLCLVCGDYAVGTNFNVPTCAPCKAFFRRNAVKLGNVDFVCQMDGDCPVISEFRRGCNCCRLAKCFRVGMQKSLIRSEAEKEARKELIQQNRQKRAKLEMIRNSTVIRQTIICYLPEKGPKVLSTPDQTLLTNVLYGYERIYVHADRCEYPSFPSIEHSTIHTFYNECGERHKTLIEYFKLIPEFNRLSIDDRVRLMQNNFEGLMTFNEAILARTFPQSLKVSFENLFGATTTNVLIHMTDRIRTYTCDPLLLKLILIIWSLSSGINKYHINVDMDFVFDDTLAIFAGQNIYVELLWGYLLRQMPSTRDAVKFFNKFVLNLLLLQRCCCAADEYVMSVENEVHKMKPLMQSMYPISKTMDIMDYDDIDEVLWID